MHATSEQLLFLYDFCYPAVFPQRGLRMQLAGLAALRRRPPQPRAAFDRLRDAVRVLGITHGDDHEVTRDAAAALAKVQAARPLCGM